MNRGETPERHPGSEDIAPRLAIRAKKARRTKGRCPYCRTTMTVGQPIALLPGIGWAHSRCAAERVRATSDQKEETMTRDVDHSEVARYEAWAQRLGLTRSRRTPCPCSLLGWRCCAYGRGASGYSGAPSLKCRELCDPHGQITEWDHGRLWNRRGRPIVAVSELYGDSLAERAAERFAGRLPAELFTVILAAADGSHATWNPGSCTPVLLVSKRHRDARDTVRDLLRLDPQAQVVTTGGCS